MKKLIQSFSENFETSQILFRTLTDLKAIVLKVEDLFLTYAVNH